MRFEEIPHTLILRAQEGDPAALEEFCMIVQPGAYAVLLSLLRNGEDASDALQESMIRIIRFLPDLRDPAALPGWLMRLLSNQAAAGHRQRPAAVIDVSSLDAEKDAAKIASTSAPPPSPRRAAERSEIQKHINHAITLLPDRQRTALVLFEVEQLTIRQVAQIMELTDGAVKFHLHEARKNLRRHLEEIGIPNASPVQEFGK